MPSIHPRTNFRTALGAGALALVALACGVATNAAGAADPPSAKHRTAERLVVRGDATVVDHPCQGPVCQLDLVDGSFRGTPVGTGPYAGSVELTVAEAFSNGEGGVCAPLESRVVLGAGTPDRLVLTVTGDSCQDGAGPVTTTAFTGLARFVVKYGTGEYAGATGGGLASFVEDAADHDRMTLMGHISR